MADVFTKEKRKEVMSRIQGKDTKFEVLVRKYLFNKGFRFRKNDSRYPGKPDIVLPKYKVAILINGCFWHRHEGCKCSYIPKTNTDFWMKKFQRNIDRDNYNYEQLSSMGFKVVILWECELKTDFEYIMNNVVNGLKNETR